MYIKVTKNSAGQQYYHLVESYWENGKSRQRTLMALGKAGDDRMDEVIAAIGKHKEVLTILELAKNISADEMYILGPRVTSHTSIFLTAWFGCYVNCGFFFYPLNHRFLC